MKIGNRYISVMGLLYSGSSAVFDYIRQFEGLGYMSNDESRIFMNGISELYELKKRGREPTEDIVERISRIFSGDFDKSLYSCFGNIKINSRMFHGIDTNKSGKLIREFLEDIKDVDVKKFILLAREFIDNFCSLKVSEKIRVLNNDPGASLIGTTLLFDKNKSVVVYRDICDQFTDQINHRISHYNYGSDNNLNMENAEIFVDILNRKIRLFVRDIEFIKKYNPSRINDIYIVSFEGFIKKKKVRDDLGNFLGLLNPTLETFFPEQSILNIGISKDIPGDVRNYITSEVRINNLIK